MTFERLEKLGRQQIRLMVDHLGCVRKQVLSCRGRGLSSSELLLRYLDSAGLNTFPCPSVSIRVHAFGNACIENLAKLDKSIGSDYDHLGSRG